MRKWMSVAFLLFLSLGLPALGAWAGYRAAYLRLRKKPWEVNALVRERVEKWRQNETMAGAFAIANESLDGVENCYYHKPIDFSRITWIGKDVPTPFVGFAPAPGPLASGYINSMQFRYCKELQMPKPEGVCRIFLVGGSTAYSSGATSNDTTIGGYLEGRLNKEWSIPGCRFEVITAAACAWTSTHERILIENRLVELEPDIVVSLSGANDAHWCAHDRNVQWFRAFQDDYFFTLANSVLACNFDDEFPEAEPGVGPSVSHAQGTERLSRNVFLANAALQRVGADYCFALQPMLAASKKARTPREERMGHRYDASGLVSRYDHFGTALAGVELPQFHFFNLAGVFDLCDDRTDIFIDTCHFGDCGNDLIAQALRDRLRPIIQKRFEAISAAP